MNNTHCEHCGASLKKFWHRLTPGLVQSLIKFRHAVEENNCNSLHLYNDLRGENELTTTEQMNWTKLRFHGLVAKDDKNEKHWVLTHRGAQFLNGEIQIPKKVQTFRNHLIAKDLEMVTIKDVIDEVPIWQERCDFAFDFASEQDMDTVKVAMGKKKKGMPACPTCGTNLKINLKAEEDKATGMMKMLGREYVCPNCTFRQEYLPVVETPRAFNVV